MIELGKKAKDSITGFEGTVTAKTEWLTGCTRYALQGICKKGDVPPEEQWFDESRLESAEIPIIGENKDNGGPRNDPHQVKGY